MTQASTVARQARTSVHGDRGVFVTLEGGEGAGKSVQAAALAGRLEAYGCGAICTREPGGTPLGERLRDIVLGYTTGSESILLDPLTETLIFATARAELVASVILPALTLGEVVLCDRFADSTVAYQGYGRGVDPAMIAQINAVASHGLHPDLTALLDLPVNVGLARATNTGRADRFERQGEDFHERVRQGYLELAEQEPDRWVVVDGELPQEQVTELIWQRLLPLLEARR